MPKHVGLTAFLVPMHAPGVDVRPLRQMSGGASFNEVFFDSVRVGDELRLGGVGDGWRVAMTTLGFERSSAGGGGGTGKWSQVLMLAEHLGAEHRPGDPPAARRAVHPPDRGVVEQPARRRRRPGRPDARARRARSASSPTPRGCGPSATSSPRCSAPRFTADTGEWGTFAWTEHLTGTPGYRIAAGSDEVQRNIIGERVLGLPPEPRVDRDAAFAELMRQ